MKNLLLISLSLVSLLSTLIALIYSSSLIFLGFAFISALSIFELKNSN